MSLQKPTIQEITKSIISKLESALNQDIPLLVKSFMRVLSKSLAGLFTILYSYSQFNFLQMFVKTASASEVTILGQKIIPLNDIGERSGAGIRGEPKNAELLIDVTVNNQVGILPSSVQLINTSNGVTYITIGSILLDAPVVQTIIKAVSDQVKGGGSGSIGNLQPGDIVSFVNPFNVSRNATVVSQVVTGADAEDVEAYRERISKRFKTPPQGGALADYQQWGEEPAGIINVYPYKSDCPGQVDVYVEATPESSGNLDGIPTIAQLQEVLDNINFDVDGRATRRPTNDLVNTIAITRTGLDVQVLGLVVDDLAQVQQDITKAVESYFLEREPFIEGLSLQPRLDRITESGVSGVVDTIVSNAGGIFSNIILYLGIVVTPIYTLGIGEKAKAQSVAFI